MKTTIAVLLSALSLVAAEKYSGPRPPKADVPYLLHADNILPVEAAVAKEEKRKGATAYVIGGATSSARTPLAEPIFLVQTEKLVPEKLSAYRLQVREGSREIAFPENAKKQGPEHRPIPLKITKLDDRLYRIEFDQPVENGEYALTPEGANDTFSFTVY
jgi:hypothetical protein